jgi:hypothetical protein
MNDVTMPTQEERLSGQIASLKATLESCGDDLTAKDVDIKKCLSRIGHLTHRTIVLEKLLQENGIEVPA